MNYNYLQDIKITSTRVDWVKVEGEGQNCPVC